MSASESDPAAAPPDTSASFVEDDRRETHLGFGSGGVPFYVAVLWVGFIVAYVIGVSLLVLPDLRAWMKH